jgi:predicted anti-sigma-YlaC factor YlaD
MLSRYLDGELGQSARVALEAHLSGCSDCRGFLESLTSTVEALRSMRPSPRPGLAESVVAALRTTSSSPSVAPELSARQSDLPTLTVVPNLGSRGIEHASGGAETHAPRRRIARALIRYCMRRPQLRLTLPLALLAGVALSLINQGYMIFNGRVDVGMCAICALDFLIPFLALNAGLLLATRVAGRRRL